MRVTNAMIQNQMLLNISRNLRTMDKLYNQQSTGKRVIVPSDDPIAASRALALRTNVAEAKQYQKNAAQASSWMEVTEQAYNNTIDIMQRIRELAVEGSNDTLSTEDRKKISTDIQSLVKQLGTEMNATYAGRYVFSGYRTDEEPSFTKNYPDMAYTITQNFSASDLQNKDIYQKTAIDDEGQLTNCEVIRLAYDDIENLGVNVVDADGNVLETLTSTAKSVNDADAYQPGDDDVYYIQETGELVLGKNVVEKIKDNNFAVTYDKIGFNEGDLNPKVYFDCKDINPASDDFGKVFSMNAQDQIRYEIGTGTTVVVNSTASNVLTGSIYGEFTSFTSSILNMNKSTEASLRLKYEAEGYTGAELQEQIEKQLQKEEALMSAAAQDAFSDLIKICDDSIASVSVQHTNLGSRMNRLDLIASRLKNEESTYKELLSETEDADIVQVIIELSSAEVIYNASMKAGTSLIQTSLVDFI